ncbi:hypothetical protein BCR32DRAFT_282735 [Anaeromyces robustus]|uniref:Uncharacterized protein n=1 Tax=Anaeromyces robustus TaxID=1754192 RepID=A0A1Y1WX44_9FUNG|nr:hypothetical protein BCR32DRAFT_282735 [Anaeromyces robustus]|eukprot:ORX77965.1 hypothetical protein BCR32DRAFT_282735 [Anaeromyces robustus]
MNSESSISNFMETSDFDFIYKNLPETGTGTGEFASSTANPEFQKIFQSHFNRINIINCHNFNNQSTCTPEISAIKEYSGPAALKLAQSGKKVVVLIFADATNVGGIYMTRFKPANTQEEQTVLMAPEIYGYLGNNYGVHDIGGNGDGTYNANQKRYCLNKDDYDNNPNLINPAYGYILTNLLVTHEVEYCSNMIKLPKEKIVEISYAFLSMPSFSTDISRDPIGAALIGQSGEKDGEKIYSNMREASIILQNDEKIGKDVYSSEIKQDIGKLAIFYSINKLKDFSNKYFNNDHQDVSKIISIIVKAKILLNKGKAAKELKKELKLKDFKSFTEDVIKIVEEAQKNYEECVLNKFINLIKGTEKAEADTLVLGKIGCGAFLNDEDEIAELMGKAISTSKYIKYIYFAGLDKSDPFIEKVKKAMKK